MVVLLAIVIGCKGREDLKESGAARVAERMIQIGA